MAKKMDVVKYPRSSWIFFVLHNKDRFTELPHKERVRNLSAEWRMLSLEQKQVFVQLSERDRNRFTFMTSQLTEVQKQTMKLTHRVKCKGVKHPWTTFMSDMHKHPDVSQLSPPLRAIFCAQEWKKRKLQESEPTTKPPDKPKEEPKEKPHVENGEIWTHCETISILHRLQTGVARHLYTRSNIGNRWVCVRAKGRGNGLCFLVVLVGDQVEPFVASALDISNGYSKGTKAFPIMDVLTTKPFLLHNNHAKTSRLQSTDQQFVHRLLNQRHKIY